MKTSIALAVLVLLAPLTAHAADRALPTTFTFETKIGDVTTTYNGPENMTETVLLPTEEFSGWRCYRSAVAPTADGKEKAAGFGCFDGEGHIIRLAVAFCSVTTPEKNTSRSFLFTAATGTISFATQCETRLPPLK
jgi:hypothetical protein